MPYSIEGRTTTGEKEGMECGRDAMSKVVDQIRTRGKNGVALECLPLEKFGLVEKKLTLCASSKIKSEPCSASFARRVCWANLGARPRWYSRAFAMHVDQPSILISRMGPEAVINPHATSASWQSSRSF
jgi:hypothetical protein